MLRHYTLADDDPDHIRERRRPENRIGFALQLCALRYPRRLLSHGEAIPEKVLRFISAQLGITGEVRRPRLRLGKSQGSRQSCGLTGPAIQAA